MKHKAFNYERETKESIYSVLTLIVFSFVLSYIVLDIYYLQIRQKQNTLQVREKIVYIKEFTNRYR